MSRILSGNWVQGKSTLSSNFFKAAKRKSLVVFFFAVYKMEGALVLNTVAQCIGKVFSIVFI